MSNEQYLFVSYPLAGLAAIGLGWATVRVLRGSFAGTIEWLTTRHLAQVLRRAFGPGMVLMAMAGFLSVNYRGCGEPSTYPEILADRALLVSKTHQQVAGSFEYLGYAVVGWAVLLTIAFSMARNRSAPKS